MVANKLFMIESSSSNAFTKPGISTTQIERVNYLHLSSSRRVYSVFERAAAVAAERR